MHYKRLQVGYSRVKQITPVGDSLCLVPPLCKLWPGSPLESPPRGNEETALLYFSFSRQRRLKQPQKMGWFLLSKISIEEDFLASFNFPPHLIQQLSVPMVSKASLDTSTSYFFWRCGSSGFLLDILLIQSSSKVVSLSVMFKKFGIKFHFCPFLVSDLEHIT